MKQIVCLSHTPWQEVPTRTQQLMTRLKGAQILFFEPPGKTRGKEGRRVRPGLTVYTLPPILEVEQRYTRLFRMGQKKLARFIEERMDRHRFRQALLWCTGPESVHLLDYLAFRALVYDCDRDWSHLPIRWESDLALAADVVFAASPGLIHHLSPCSANIALLPNGVNYPMFSRSPVECPAELRRISGPVLGYVGGLRRDLDLSPALRAARLLPQCTFVFVGRRERNPLLRQLEELPNAAVLGFRPQMEIPDYLARFDVCLNFLCEADRGGDVIPARIYEYLSTGKPVVSMFYPEQVEHFPDVVYGAHSPEEFARLCRRALAETGDWARERRREYGLAAAWSLRAQEVDRILETIGFS